MASDQSSQEVMGAADLNALLSHLSVLDALHRLPDSAALTTDEAAIFLRVSVTTLERLRRDGNGPVYIQGGAAGARGINQRVTYLKSDLIEHQNNQRVKSTLAAAIRRGQAFMPGTVALWPVQVPDIGARRPFYHWDGQLLEAVDMVPIGEIVDRLGKVPICWAAPIRALALSWSDPCARMAYARVVRHAVTAYIDQVVQ